MGSNVTFGIDFSGFRKFLSHATYKGSIDMKQVVDENRKVPTQCKGGKGCEDCETSSMRTITEQWRRVEGEFIGVSAANISLQCPMSPLG